MKLVFVFFLFFCICGCASASPLDLFVPTRKPSAATTEYLGHLLPTNAVPANKMYHSLIDTKIEKALVPVRKMELQGLHFAAKGETEIIDAMGSKFSNGIWGGITAILVATGYMTPRPKEKAKITEALYSAPPTPPPTA